MFSSISYLWYNVVGCVVVVMTGLIVSALVKKQRPGVIPGGRV